MHPRLHVGYQVVSASLACMITLADVLNSIDSAANTMGLERLSKGPNSLGMLVSMHRQFHSALCLSDVVVTGPFNILLQAYCNFFCICSRC